MLLLKNKNIWFIISLILLISCKDKQKSIDEHKELIELRNHMYEKSISIIGAREYKLVYEQIGDSINMWKKNNLNLYRYFDTEVKYQVDSLLCFNYDKNKVITSILKQNVEENNAIDAIWYFYGVKVNGMWYFFDGGSVVLLRERYQNDIHTPLSFGKLKELAIKYIYQGYLKKNKNGDWIINDDFFNDLISSAWCIDCLSQEQWDSAYLIQVKRNWALNDKAY